MITDFGGEINILLCSKNKCSEYRVQALW